MDLSDAKVAQVVADAEPGVDLSAAEDVEVNKNTTKSSSCECCECFGATDTWYIDSY